MTQMMCFDLVSLLVILVTFRHNDSPLHHSPAYSLLGWRAGSEYFPCDSGQGAHGACPHRSRADADGRQAILLATLLETRQYTPLVSLSQVQAREKFKISLNLAIVTVP
jgi:hypothetical protein